MTGEDAWYGDGPQQRAPIQVMIVATHTDMPAFRRLGIDFLPGIIEQLNAHDNKGNTPLMLAARFNKPAIVDMPTDNPSP